MIVERVQRCKVCRREMKVSAAAFQEHPFCRRCLGHRLRAESPGRPVGFEADESGYAVAVMPARGTPRP
jgi:hypothetical protein